MADSIRPQAGSARRGGVFISTFLLCMGFAPVVNVAGSAGFQAMRSIDIVRLMASGGCFGAALAALAILVFGGHRSS